MKRSTFAIGAALLVGAAPAIAQTQNVRVRGTIASFKDNVVTVTTAGGPVRVALSPNVRVQIPVRFSLADIKPGSFVGTTAVPQADGTLRAVEVHVFPPERAAQKPGEGHRPFDLVPQGTMTNATVTNVATATVQGVQNRVLTLTYKDGEKKVVIPPNTPIVMNVPGTVSDVVAGAKISITAQRNGDNLTSSQLTVSKNGVDPVT
jgi:hypothetical protein